MIETLQLRPAPVARELIEAIELLREMKWGGLRKVPQNAPLGFLRRRREAYVLGPEAIDRRFYELCVMAELKNSSRSGDVLLAGSRQFRDFEDYLMPHPELDRRLTQGQLHVAVPTIGAAYIEQRMSLLRSALDHTDALAREDQLRNAELNSAGPKISPLENGVPKEGEALRDALSSMLSHVKITDQLMEVDRWTGFSRHFIHLKTNEAVKDPSLLSDLQGLKDLSNPRPYPHILARLPTKSTQFSSCSIRGRLAQSCDEALGQIDWKGGQDEAAERSRWTDGSRKAY
ncbi:Mobile element protein [Acidisarcina polymorpha]|uniref:Mobile element protein n=1 Tax=Acidisarcina polymorpha TaxID=2211140 RepID=A0A2Z5G7K1_9BACT|nr:hypothetical protein [Acidisarcina polymorpha]AXC14787.1 Mobile element protein [Acidisarcina polymorpha]